MQDLYDRDFYAWTQQQADAAKKGEPKFAHQLHEDRSVFLTVIAIARTITGSAR